MTKVEQIESDIGKLSPSEQRQIRDWLDDILEDQMEFTPEFEARIQQSERDRQAGQADHVCQPEAGATVVTDRRLD